MREGHPNDARILAPKRAVVTGAGGFIGRYVTRQLVELGCSVRGIGHSEMPRKMLDTLALDAWYPGGIKNRVLAEAARDAEVIFHCAGSGSVPLSLERPMGDFRSNVTATAKVLNFSRKSGRIPVVFLSSAGVYGKIDRLPIPTTAFCNPVSPYGVNKRIGEKLMHQYAAYFGVPSVVVRLFSVYGNGLRKQLLWDASHKMHQGNLNFFGTGDETRDWIHVEDAAALIVRLWRNAGLDVPTYNGATGEGVSIRRILETLAGAYGITDPITFNGEVRPGDPRDYVADVSASLATGWGPRISLEEGLARYAEWFQKDVLPDLRQKQS